MKQVVDIPGQPLGYKETRTIITYKKVKQTADCCIIEQESQNLDAPSSDTFTVFCSIIVVATPKAPDKCMLAWYYLVNFVKFSFVKVVIRNATDSAINNQFKEWLDLLGRQGLLKPKPKPPKVESLKIDSSEHK